MRKIANTTELQSELTRILRYARTARPSRIRLAKALTGLSYRVAALDEERFEQFSKAYREGLLAAVQAKPDDYWMRDATPEEYADTVSAKMLREIRSNPKMVNYNGGGFARACRALKIKPTRKAIFEFLGIS